MNSAALPAGRFFPSVWKLLLLRMRISLNSFRHARTRAKIGMVILAVVVLAFAIGIFIVSRLLLGFLRSPQLVRFTGVNPAPFLAAVPVLIFTGLFLGILLSSFGVLLQALYLSGDMDFLLTSPVPIRAVFVTKLMQAVLPNFGLIALFGLPVLYGLGISGGYNFLYYPFVILTMILLALTAAGISALLVMLVARLFPPRRVAELLGFLGATLSILCSQFGSLTNLYRPSRDISGNQVDALFNGLTKLNTPWLPLNWAGQGLVELGQGHWLSGVLLVGVTVGLCSTIFWFTLGIAERWYYTGWASMQVVAQRKRGTAPARSSSTRSSGLATSFKQILPAPVRGILSKDFLVLRRDLRNLSQLVTPLIFGIIYSLVYLRAGGRSFSNLTSANATGMPAWLINSFRSLLPYGNVGLALLVGWTLLSRLAGMSFSAEGKNYWILKASPVRTSHLLIAKFLVAYVPALALGLFFLIGLSILQHVPIVGFLYSLLVVMMCLGGLNGIMLAFGVAGANFTWEDPRRMNAGLRGCLGSIVAIAAVPITFGLFIGPLWIVAALNLPALYGYLVGGLLGGAVSAFCTLFPPWVIRGKVAHLGEV